MAIEKHPCEDGLLQECFAKYPAWAKQALAYKLMHVLCPAEITRRLPKWLRLALVGDGVILPPGFTPPEGTTIPPGYTFPPGWSPGDPLPDSFGPSPPPGIIIPPYGAVSPIYLDPNDPGPRHRASPGPPVGEVTAEIIAENDGRIRLRWGTWNTIHDAVTGGTIWTTGATGFPAIRTRNSLGDYSITRSFLDFDLSGIPATATVISCTLMVHGYIDANCNGIVQEGTQSDSLALEDYDGFTGSQFDTIAFTTSPMTFTLNEAGKAYIESKCGSTAKLCIREYDHDYLDVPPGMDETYQAGMHYSEATDPDKRPKLSVTYEQ